MFHLKFISTARSLLFFLAVLMNSKQKLFLLEFRLFFNVPTIKWIPETKSRKSIPRDIQKQNTEERQLDVQYRSIYTFYNFFSTFADAMRRIWFCVSQSQRFKPNGIFSQRRDFICKWEVSSKNTMIRFQMPFISGLNLYSDI